MSRAVADVGDCGGNTTTGIPGEEDVEHGGACEGLHSRHGDPPSIVLALDANACHNISATTHWIAVLQARIQLRTASREPWWVDRYLITATTYQCLLHTAYQTLTQRNCSNRGFVRELPSMFMVATPATV